MKLHPIKQPGMTSTAFEEEGHKITSIDPMDLTPGLYRGVVIKMLENEHILDIPEYMDAVKFRFWKKSPAGILSRDLIRKSRNKEVGEWFLVESENFNTIIRTIKDEELAEFDALKIVHGKLKDSYYMHLKTVPGTKNVNWYSGYINQTKTTEFDDDEMSESLDESEKGTKHKDTPRAGSLFK